LSAKVDFSLLPSLTFTLAWEMPGERHLVEDHRWRDSVLLKERKSLEQACKSNS